MSHIEKEKLIKADIASIENRVRHAFNQGYDLGYKEGKANCSEIPTGSPKYCDRSICLKNEYNNVGCEDCEVTKSQESSGDNVVSRDVVKEQMIMYGFHAPDMTVTEFVEDLPPVNPKEPTNKNNLGVDAISRADARSLICKIDIKHRMLGMSRKVFKDLYNGMDELPSVTPQTRKGHWFLTDVEGYRVWHCNCSECDKDPQDYIGGSENWWLIKSKLPKFCPHCGADMREVEE